MRKTISHHPYFCVEYSLQSADPRAEKPRWVPIYTARNPNGRRGHSVVVKSHAPNEFFLFGGQRGKCVFCIMLWVLFHQSHCAASPS
jgi:hypothetical protein